MHGQYFGAARLTQIASAQPAINCRLADVEDLRRPENLLFVRSSNDANGYFHDVGELRRERVRPFAAAVT